MWEKVFSIVTNASNRFSEYTQWDGLQHNVCLYIYKCMLNDKA